MIYYSFFCLFFYFMAQHSKVDVSHNKHCATQEYFCLVIIGLWYS